MPFAVDFISQRVIFRVRCEYGDYVKGSIADRKDELEQQKIKQAEKRIAKQQLKKKQEARLLTCTYVVHVFS